MSECMTNNRMNVRSNTMNSTRCDNAANTMSREDLLQHINEVSFAVYDTLLYLDTHHCDEAAMEYYREMMQKRKEAMKEYCEKYGPLTVDCDTATADGHWQWAHQPWPWEGGRW